jgi:hypothetical protein
MKNIFTKFLTKKKNRTKMSFGNTNEFGGIIAPSNPIALVDEPVTFTSTVDVTNATVIGLNTAPGWELTGNTGTDEVTNFIGTIDSKKFFIRTFNTTIAEFPTANSGNIIIGKGSSAVNFRNLILGSISNNNNNGFDNVILGRNVINLATGTDTASASLNVIAGNSAATKLRSSANVILGHQAAEEITINSGDNIVIGRSAVYSTGNPADITPNLTFYSDDAWTQVNSNTWQKIAPSTVPYESNQYVPVQGTYSYRYRFSITAVVTAGNFYVNVNADSGNEFLGSFFTSTTINTNKTLTGNFSLIIFPSDDFLGTVSFNITHVSVNKMTNSLVLGNFARPKDDNQTNQIVIGDSAIGSGSNTVTIGNTSIVDTFLKGNLNLAGYGLGNITGAITRLLGVTTDGKVVEKVQPKVYVAKVVFSGTSAPTATVLENTLGGTPVWTRESQGTYRVTLASAFTLAKTFVSHNQVYPGTPNNSLQSVNIHTSADFIGISNNIIDNNLFQTADITADAMYIEIRVYP